MQPINVDGVNLESDTQGAGESVLLIHGGIFADGFFPLLSGPAIAGNYRVISYHRRGFAGGTHAKDSIAIGQQAVDGDALLRHLGIPRAHIAGHSYGATIALQGALDAPTQVRSLALLDPRYSHRFLPGRFFGKRWRPSGRCMNRRIG